MFLSREGTTSSIWNKNYVNFPLAEKDQTEPIMASRQKSLDFAGDNVGVQKRRWSHDTYTAKCLNEKLFSFVCSEPIVFQ